ncbi:MAG: phospholipase D family protein [Sedimentisphaerales bacterium]|nr:phospholipase D family protein [Sedimentisphaerales bacterium]
MKQFASDKWTRFRGAIAFVKRSGIRHLATAISEFCLRAEVKIIVGIDCRGTSVEGLSDLMDCIQDNGEIYVFHNENMSTFHPKVYLFSSNTMASVAVGSGNITEGGLFTNYETALAISLDLTDQGSAAFFEMLESVLDEWANVNSGTCKRLNSTVLGDLQDAGYIVTEALTRVGDGEEGSRTQLREKEGEEAQQRLFIHAPVPRAPRPTIFAAGTPSVTQAEEVRLDTSEGALGFVMTLQRTDVGAGQTTPGTSRRSPEIFVPLAARDFSPEFWGWPMMFSEDPERRGKMDRKGVLMRIGTEILEVNMMTWPDKHDFRLRNERLRSAGNIGDILRIEKTPDNEGFQYYVEVIPKGTSQHQTYLSICINTVRNSPRLWGYYV